MTPRCLTDGLERELFPVRTTRHLPHDAVRSRAYGLLVVQRLYLVQIVQIPSKAEVGAELLGSELVERRGRRRFRGAPGRLVLVAEEAAGRRADAVATRSAPAKALWSSPRLAEGSSRPFDLDLDFDSSSPKFSRIQSPSHAAARTSRGLASARDGSAGAGVRRASTRERDPEARSEPRGAPTARGVAGAATREFIARRRARSGEVQMSRDATSTRALGARPWVPRTKGDPREADKNGRLSSRFRARDSSARSARLVRAGREAMGGLRRGRPRTRMRRRMRSARSRKRRSARAAVPGASRRPYGKDGE